MKRQLFLSTVLFFFMFSIFGQTCCSGGVPLSNNLGLPTLQKGSWQVGFSYDYNNLNTLNIGIKKIDDSSRLRVTHSMLVNLGYSITDKLAVEMLFSWVNQRRRITQLNTPNLDESAGIGDAIFLGRYTIMSDNRGDFSIGLGAKLPVGSSTQKNNQGVLLNADLQPGSNSIDFIMMTTYSQKIAFRKSMNFSTRVTYRSTGTNSSYQGSSDYKFGSEFQTFLGISDQLLVFKQIFSPSLTLKYRNAIKDQINNISIENTGGNWIFLIPSFMIHVNQQLSFSSNIEIPLYSNVQGTQLTPTYRINTGLLYQFTKKTNLNFQL